MTPTDNDTGTGSSPRASPRPDLSGHLLGILETAGEAVHIGTLRLVEKFVVCHEGGDLCCEGTVVLLPYEQVTSIVLYETRERLDAEAKKLGYSKATDAKRDSPEVR